MNYYNNIYEIVIWIMIKIENFFEQFFKYFLCNEQCVNIFCNFYYIINDINLNNWLFLLVIIWLINIVVLLVFFQIMINLFLFIKIFELEVGCVFCIK